MSNKKNTSKKKKNNWFLIILIIYAIIVILVSTFCFVYTIPSEISLKINSYYKTDKIALKITSNDTIVFYSPSMNPSNYYYSEMYVVNITASCSGYLRQGDGNTYGMIMRYSTNETEHFDFSSDCQPPRYNECKEIMIHFIPRNFYLKPGERITGTLIYPANETYLGNPIGIEYAKEFYPLQN